jgi:hypothetical protein
MDEWLTSIHGLMRDAWWLYVIVASLALLTVSLIVGESSIAILSGLSLLIAVARVVHLARARGKRPAPDDGWGRDR